MASSHSKIWNHLQANKDHKVDFYNPQTVTSFHDKYKLLISFNSNNLILTWTPPYTMHSANLTHD